MFYQVFMFLIEVIDKVKTVIFWIIKKKKKKIE